MDKWTKNRHGSGNISSPSDTIVATVLRLIGEYVGLEHFFADTRWLVLICLLGK